MGKHNQAARTQIQYRDRKYVLNSTLFQGGSVVAKSQCTSKVQ